MPLIDQGDHHGTAAVEELFRDLVADTIHALPAGATTACRRQSDRLHRPRLVRQEGSPQCFSHREVAPIREDVPLTDAPEPAGRQGPGATKIRVIRTDNTPGAAV
ncbi:hypothetical protein [Streptomyces sp. NBC_00847]|uniref:hypothetical protein n=1 Tax=Streptomyces sp. NBC_00847 TaxID=2975850 RepID=UPI00225573E6|nr:hypothetical protein [Streptomyces sp. NBC_00847]MCX4878229.1 hypothetical protein [Streptomyces sp. NBC_00847]